MPAESVKVSTFLVGKILTLLIVVTVVGSLVMTNTQAFKTGFTVEPKEEVNQPFQVVSTYKDFNWNFMMFNHMRENRSDLVCNVEPLYPPRGAIPAYHIVELEYMKPNFNHRPVFVFDKGKVNSYWIAGVPIQDMYNLQFNYQNKASRITFLLPDQNNQFPNHVPASPEAKIILPTWNLIEIELKFNERSVSYTREDVNFSETIETTHDFAMQRNSDNTHVIQTQDMVFVAPSDSSFPERASGKVTFTELDRPFNHRPNPAYRGEVFLLHNKGNAELVKFTPNEFSIRVTNLTSPDTLVLNQNYFKGWFEKNSGQKAINTENKTSLSITKEGTYIFKYRAPGFFLGMFISIISLVILILMIRFKWLNRILEKIMGLR